MLRCVAPESYSYGTCKVLTQHMEGVKRGKGTEPSCKEQKCKFEREERRKVRQKPRVESDRKLGGRRERLQDSLTVTRVMTRAGGSVVV